MNAECSSGDIPPGYKQTEVGVIPEDWEVIKLSHISSFITKGSTPTTYGFKWEDSGVLFLRSECVSECGLDLTQSMFISEAANSLLRRSEVSDGDILLTITGNVGRAVLLSGINRANINQHIARVRIISPNIVPSYIFHFLSQSSSRNRFNTITTGQAYPQISLKQVREAKISIPPTKAEQESIAEALSDADAFIESLEQLIAKKRQIKQGAMQELLTGKRRLPGFETKASYKQTEVGVIPEDWAAVELKAVVINMVQGVNTAIDKPEYVNSGIPMLKANNVIDQEVLFDGADYISPKTFAGYSDRFKLRKNDFLFSNIGARLGTGSLLKVDIDCSFAWNVMRIVPNTKKIVPQYLSSIINSPNISQGIRNNQSGSGMGFVSKGILEKVLIPIPPTLNEQEAIATILSDMDFEITVLEEKLAKTRQIKQGMMQELLTGRIRLI